MDFANEQPQNSFRQSRNDTSRPVVQNQVSRILPLLSKNGDSFGIVLKANNLRSETDQAFIIPSEKF